MMMMIQVIHVNYSRWQCQDPGDWRRWGVIVWERTQRVDLDVRSPFCLASSQSNPESSCSADLPAVCGPLVSTALRRN